jgi:nucleotide-binding universal stress UspA family protein
MAFHRIHFLANETPSSKSLNHFVLILDTQTIYAMKRILVPTDFSDCAGFAADAAIRMAEQHGAEVIMYTRIPGDQSEDFKEAADVSGLPMSIAEKFKTLLAPYANAGTVFRLMYSSKDLVPGVLELAEKEDVALIVMGSSGAGGLKELVWGSMPSAW